MNPPFKTALLGIDEKTSISYAMLQQGVRQLAHLLEMAAVPQGSVINISCQGRLNQAVYLLCGLQLPYIISPLNPSYKKGELGRIIDHSQTALVITDQPTLFEDFPVKRLVADVEGLCSVGESTGVPTTFQCPGQLLIYTSGTTGQPKGILLTGQNIMKNTDEAIGAFGYTDQSVSASILPMFHTFTLISDLIPLIRQGGTCVICPTFTAQSSFRIQQAILDHGVQSFSAVPIIFQVMSSLFKPVAESPLAFVISGAAPLSELVRLTYGQKFKHPIIPCYGLGEATCFATISPMDGIKPKAVGKPAGIDIQVVDSEDMERELAAGQVGEIVVKGDSVIAAGYFKDRIERICYTESGSFITGDLGYFDEEGYLYIAGRKKNMIIRGGEKVYLEDVDRCLEEIEMVKEGVSIALVETGQQDQAISFIVLKPGEIEDPQVIIDFIRSRLSIQHTPDQILFIDEIPRTKTGKPIINELRALSLVS
ncbi:MAG: class I adenylate-forming enzyme family protein [Bacteroidota bacterium]